MICPASQRKAPAIGGEVRKLTPSYSARMLSGCQIGRGTKQIAAQLFQVKGWAMTEIVLPYGPQYTGHRELEKRREVTKWLQRREFELSEKSSSVGA